MRPCLHSRSVWLSQPSWFGISDPSLANLLVVFYLRDPVEKHDLGKYLVSDQKHDELFFHVSCGTPVLHYSSHWSSVIRPPIPCSGSERLGFFCLALSVVWSLRELKCAQSSVWTCRHYIQTAQFTFGWSDPADPRILFSMYRFHFSNLSCPVI